MRIKVVIAKEVGRESYTAVLHWGGGVRFSNPLPTQVAANTWLNVEVSKLLDEFEVLVEESADVKPKGVIVVPKIGQIDPSSFGK